MDSSRRTGTVLKNVDIDVKLRLSALWTAVMFLYAYADIQHFVLQSGSLEEILRGELGGMQLTPAFLFGAAVLMTMPALMVFLSVALKATANRWTNIVVGTAYTLVTIATMLMPGETWAYYFFYNVVEIVLTGLVVWHAVTWPKQEA
jgi:hypothetical protein